MLSLPTLFLHSRFRMNSVRPPFSGGTGAQMLNSKVFKKFKVSGTYKRREKPHTNHLKKSASLFFIEKSVFDQKVFDSLTRILPDKKFYLSIELVLILPYL